MLMVTITFDTFKHKTVEVDWMPGTGATATFELWKCAPTGGVIHGQNITQVQDAYLEDVALVVVPHEFATFVKPVFPLLEVHHFKLSTTGERELGAVTYMAAEPHVCEVVLRLTKVDNSILAISIPRMQVELQAMASIWKAAVEKGIGLLQPGSRVEMNETLQRFQEGWSADKECELKNATGAAAMVLEGARAVVKAAPAGGNEAAAPPEAVPGTDPLVEMQGRI